MQELFAYLREFNLVSVFIRLVLAMLCGGIIGIERERKSRAAGFRTYMIVCIGATLTMLLGQYEACMIQTTWAGRGLTTDVTRLGAQVINGIGFLGAGIVIVTGHQQVKGLTTAAALWASACTGLAIGVGFYEGVGFTFLLILFVVRILPLVENYIVEKSKNINIYIEFDELNNLGNIIGFVKAQNARIYEVDVDRGEIGSGKRPSAVFFICMNKQLSHTELLLRLSKNPCIRQIEEI